MSNLESTRSSEFYQIEQLRKELDEERTERKKLHLALKEFEQHMYMRTFLNTQGIEILSLRGTKEVNTFIAFLRKTYGDTEDVEQLLIQTPRERHQFVINHPLYLQYELDKYTEFNLP